MPRNFLQNTHYASAAATAATAAPPQQQALLAPQLPHPEDAHATPKPAARLFAFSSGSSVVSAVGARVDAAYRHNHNSHHYTPSLQHAVPRATSSDGGLTPRTATLSFGSGSSDDGDNQHSGSANANAHSVGEFVQVFPSVDYILPHHANATTRGQVPWRCSNCGASAFGHKCTACSRNRDASALRVFVGQLCREGSAEVTRAMVMSLCPALRAPPLHIEPHTHASNGRGKGCCWVYVDSVHDLEHVVERLHKRTYVAVDSASGAVGFRAFAGPFMVSDEEIHDAFVADMASLAPDVQQLLHRSTVTAEVPTSLAGRVQRDDGVARRTQQQQQRHSVAPPCEYRESQPQQHAACNIAVAHSTMFAAAFLGPVAPVATAAPVAPAAPAAERSSCGNDALLASRRAYRWNPYTGAKVAVAAH